MVQRLALPRLKPNTMFSDDGVNEFEFSRAYLYLPLQPSVGADIAALQQDEMPHAVLAKRIRAPAFFRTCLSRLVPVVELLR